MIPERLTRHAARYGLAVGAVAVATVVVAAVAPLGLTSQSMIYLGAILLVAVVAGRAPAILASVLAFLTFDFLFVEPRFTFTVRDPSEWLALLTFLVVAVVTSQLAAAVRDRADAAERREREARLLHDLADLMAITPLSAALAAACERLTTELSAEGVGIVVDASERAGRTTAGDPEAVRAAPRHACGGRGAHPGRAGDGGSRWHRGAPDPRVATAWRAGEARGEAPHPGPDSSGHPHARPARHPARAHEGLTDAETRLLDTVADQIALAVEREYLRQEALETEVLRRTDELKSALLDAVSHDLRTPLASIIGSAGSLRQADVTWSAG